MENEIKEPLRTGFNRGLGFGLLLVLIGLVFFRSEFWFGFERSKANSYLMAYVTNCDWCK